MRKNKKQDEAEGLGGCVRTIRLRAETKTGDKITGVTALGGEAGSC